MVGTGFISHELAHKFTAMKYGYLSEFRLWPLGLIIALSSSLLTLGSLIFAAPGATYVIPRYPTYELSGIDEKKRMGLISLAGPLSNMLWAIIFYFLSWLDGPLSDIGFHVNLWLAIFNMIPLGDLDGRKIMTWNFTIWAIVTIPLWIVEIFLIFA
ncbi:MAG: site-2 protease family protein [Crenarchaeota archaeon]|nr:site-2 protease family protein [Thermoproteota archaeon]